MASSLESAPKTSDTKDATYTTLDLKVRQKPRPVTINVISDKGGGPHALNWVRVIKKKKKKKKKEQRYGI